jgi:hypothetical protein
MSLYFLFFPLCFTVYLCGRNPFFEHKKEKKSVKICILKGTVIGDKAFGHLCYDDCDLILGVGEEVSDLVITQIDCDSLYLRNRNGDVIRLRLNESMRIGEGT